MATTPKERTGAEAVEWDLSDLYDEPEEARLRSDLDEAAEAAARFGEHRVFEVELRVRPLNLRRH